MPLILLASVFATQPATPETAVSFTALIIKLIIILVVICLLAFVVLKFILPRVGVLRTQGKATTISVLSRRALDPKKHLWIIQVGKRYFLLGSADGAVNNLAELDAKDVLEAESLPGHSSGQMEE